MFITNAPTFNHIAYQRQSNLVFLINFLYIGYPMNHTSHDIKRIIKSALSISVFSVVFFGIGALYINNYYFFRKVVCLIKKALHRIYGIYEFHYPGGVSVNYSIYKEEADEEEEEIKEFVQNNRTIDFIYMPNTI